MLLLYLKTPTLLTQYHQELYFLKTRKDYYADILEPTDPPQRTSRPLDRAFCTYNSQSFLCPSPRHPFPDLGTHNGTHHFHLQEHKQDYRFRLNLLAVSYQAFAYQTDNNHYNLPRQQDNIKLRLVQHLVQEVFYL